jgi:WD40 repeat protein
LVLASIEPAVHSNQVVPGKHGARGAFGYGGGVLIGLEVPLTCNRLVDARFSLDVGYATGFKTLEWPRNAIGVKHRVGRCEYLLSKVEKGRATIIATMQKESDEPLWEDAFVRDIQGTGHRHHYFEGKRHSAKITVRPKHTQGIIKVVVPAEGGFTKIPLTVKEIKLPIQVTTPISPSPTDPFGPLATSLVQGDVLYQITAIEWNTVPLKPTLRCKLIVWAFPLKSIMALGNWQPNNATIRIGNQRMPLKCSQEHHFLSKKTGHEVFSLTADFPLADTRLGADCTFDLNFQGKNGPVSFTGIPAVRAGSTPAAASARQALFDVWSGDNEPALAAAAQKVLDVAPQDHWTWAMAGDAFQRIGKTTKSIEAYGQALRLLPPCWMPKAYSSIITHSTGRIDQAIRPLYGNFFPAPTMARYGMEELFKKAGVERTSANTQVLEASPCPQAISIDGDLRDWEETPRQLYCDDLVYAYDRYRTHLRASHDDHHLFLAVEVPDDSPMRNRLNPMHANLGLNDSLQFAFNGSNIHLVAWCDELNAYVLMTQTSKGVVSFSHSRDGTFEGGLKVAHRRSPQGYKMELAIPWGLYQSKAAAPKGAIPFSCSISWSALNSNQMYELIANVSEKRKYAQHTGLDTLGWNTMGKLRLLSVPANAENSGPIKLELPGPKSRKIVFGGKPGVVAISTPTSIQLAPARDLLNGGRNVRTITGFSRINALVFTEQGLVIADGNTLKLMDNSDRRVVTSIGTLSESIRALAHSQASGLLACCMKSRSIQLWDLKQKALSSEIALPKTPKTLSFSPSGRKLAVGCADGRLLILDIAGRRIVHEKKLHTYACCATTFIGEDTVISAGMTCTCTAGISRRETAASSSGDMQVQ